MSGRKLILLKLLLAMQFNGYSFISNFYIEIMDNEVVIGEYSQNSFRKKEVEKFCLEKTVTTDILKALNLGYEEENVLFYFHSMWGSVAPYHKNSLKTLNRDIGNIDKIISVIWHANKLSYKTTWNNSISLGKAISPIMDSIVLSTKNKYFVLCHSMGSRVFEGVVSGFAEKNRRFEIVILAGADLDVDVFNKGFSMLPRYCHQTVVYVNKKDRLLKTSKFLHKKERLGLDAAQYIDKLSKIENLEIVNVAHSSSRKLISFSNHIYFKNNKAVVQDINHLIGGELAKREIKQKTNNFYDLK